MPMPSLFKYFAFVGACLLGLLTLVNFLLEPSTGATNIAQPKPVVAVQFDPRASKIERWRVEQAALKAAEQTQTGESASLVTKSTAAPVRPVAAPSPAAAAPSPAVQPVKVESAPAQPHQAAAAEPAKPEQSDTLVEHAEPDHAAKLAEQKAKIAKSKARKAKLARERASPAQIAAGGPVPAGARERTASNQQDQYYYGQRAGGLSGLWTSNSSSSANAYAPRPSYGPFAWGRGW